MKKTGVVRRIDELGRIVIPKEIRHNLQIREGESLEVYVEENAIVLKKFSFVNNYNLFLKKLVDSYLSVFNSLLVVTNRDQVIASTENNIILPENYYDTLKDREIKQFLFQKVIDDTDKTLTIIPLIVNSDIVGSIIIDQIDPLMMKFINVLISNILSHE